MTSQALECWPEGAVTKQGDLEVPSACSWHIHSCPGPQAPLSQGGFGHPPCLKPWPPGCLSQLQASVYPSAEQRCKITHSL